MPSRLLSTSGEELLLENRLRKSFAIGNEDVTIAVFIKKEKPGATTVSTTDHDHRIGPGGGVALSSLADGEESIQARWTIVAASGTPRISYFETEREVR